MWCRHGTKCYTGVDDVICTNFMKLSVSKVHNIKNLCRSKGLYGYYNEWSNINFDILEIHLESIFFFLISSDQNLYTLDYRDKSLQPALSNYNKNMYVKELVKLSDINFLEQKLIWVPEIKFITTSWYARSYPEPRPFVGARTSFCRKWAWLGPKKNFRKIK